MSHEFEREKQIRGRIICYARKTIVYFVIKRSEIDL